MARICRVEAVIAFSAIISRHEEAIQWACERLALLWGPLPVVSPPMPFEASEYYANEMGSGLRKIMVAAERPRDPSELADWKVATNALEADYAALSPAAEPRPLNLDPGYISQSKLVLATVKDRDHRLYLREGIFAEVTLRYLRSGWTENPWTYPDYRTDPVKTFANQNRLRLREFLKAEDGWRRRG
ncbi:DUF4416 family protein [Candidatus Laterigemmans baculatus]|uniref:DUF4416 family protein n=1 Tax=Candidatus Laterigemmans baculatus TaxID=2770505 RepID=UPI0013DA37E7|nr:DUF4416 family protein [Candidatus Laterigemmans baculatus]